MSTKIFIYGIIVVAVIGVGAFLIMRPSAPAPAAPSAVGPQGAPATPVPTAQQTEKPSGNSPAGECDLLTLDEIKSVIGSSEVTDNGVVKTEGQCIKNWITWNVQGAARIPGNSIALTVIETRANPYYKTSDPPVPLKALCKDKQSLGIGAYDSCNFMGQMSFGKGKYMVFLMCIGCAEDKSMQLSKIVESRL